MDFLFPVSSVFLLFRHRYISAACGMAILKEVPQEVMIRVLFDRINIVNLLPWLRSAVVPKQDQLDFMMAGNDKKQWEVNRCFTISLRTTRVRSHITPNLGSKGLHLADPPLPPFSILPFPLQPHEFFGQPPLSVSNPHPKTPSPPAADLICEQPPTSPMLKSP